MKSDSFRDIVYDWVSSVHNCYILPSKSPEDHFKCFDDALPFYTLHESDKEVVAGSGNSPLQYNERKSRDFSLLPDVSDDDSEDLDENWQYEPE